MATSEVALDQARETSRRAETAWATMHRAADRNPRPCIMWLVNLYRRIEARERSPADFVACATRPGKLRRMLSSVVGRARSASRRPTKCPACRSAPRLGFRRPVSRTCTEDRRTWSAPRRSSPLRESERMKPFLDHLPNRQLPQALESCWNSGHQRAAGGFLSAWVAERRPHRVLVSRDRRIVQPCSTRPSPATRQAHCDASLRVAPISDTAASTLRLTPAAKRPA